MIQSSTRRTPTRRKEIVGPEWIRVSIVAGFIATVAMTATFAVGYFVANTLGAAGGGQLSQWMYALSQNELAEQVGNAFAVGMVVNLIIGLAWALIYARFAEPRLSGPGYMQGIMFVLIPFILSVALLFPLMGAGFLGSDLGAGPFPFIGNLIAHMVYGAVLGFMYALDEAHGTSANTREHEAAASSERGSALGVVAGGVVGAVGGFVIWPSIDDLASRPVITLSGVLVGAAIGALIGSLVAMNATDEIDTSAERSPRRNNA